MSPHAHRLSDLRATLAKRDLDGFIVPRADEHLGEYVPQGAERLAFLTGDVRQANAPLVPHLHLPLRAGLRVEHALSCIEERALRFAQQPGGIIDITRVARRAGLEG